jgi:hypothetical protein
VKYRTSSWQKAFAANAAPNHDTIGSYKPDAAKAAKKRPLKGGTPFCTIPQAMVKTISKNPENEENKT